MVEDRQNALFTMRMEDMRAACIVEERQKRCVHYATSTTRGAVVFSLPSAVKLCGLQTKSSAPKRLPSCRRCFISFYSTYFTMSANRHEFKEPKLIAEFDIQRLEEGSGRKTDVAHCHHRQWNQALHALRSAAHVVLASQNHGIDSYWKQLGTESNGENTRPELSCKQKDALAMSDLLRIRHR
jgi:hypothetical protein